MKLVALRAARRLRQLHDGLRKTEHMYMVLVSVVIGLLGGLGAVGLRFLIRGLNVVAWRQGEYTLAYLHSLPWWWKLAAPAAGGLIVGLIIRYVSSEAKGHGVPEVMEAVALRGGRIRPRVVFAKLFASGISIGSGGSVGREGPIVQVGSALGSVIGQWLKVDQTRLRTLVGCGAAAGIAGAFNAPVAGALFAVEIILGDFGVSQFSPIVISSVSATVVSRHFLGDLPAFMVPTYQLVNANELLGYAFLGILAAVVAVAFIKILYAGEDLFDKIKAHAANKALVGGLMVGAIGIWAPGIFGVGYETINDALGNAATWQYMLLLVGLKIFAVSITIGSGGSGGIFAPSLFIGAMLGGALGTVMHNLWPAATAAPGAYALVGMGALVAAATHAPITAILIIFELTSDYKIILPLMISCIIATLVSTKIHSASIYTLKLLRRGIDVYGGRAVNVLRGVPVSEVMHETVLTVGPGEPLGGLIATVMERPSATLFVVDEDDTLHGVITIDELRPVMANPSTLGPLIIAQDVMATEGFPQVKPDESLSEVMRMLGNHRGEIAVVEGERLAAVIRPEDVISRYNAELFKRDVAHGMVSSLSPDRPMAMLPTSGDTAVAEVAVPPEFVGKTIAELNVRQKYGITIMLIRQPATGDRSEQLEAAPEPDYVFGDNERMLVMGTKAKLQAVL
ncbi:MAG: chloride channel protein [Gemmatimonadales bacterium]